MALSMYMDEPLNGKKPDIAIDLYDRSLKNFAPSYLTYLLNQKVMNRMVDKSSTITVSPNGEMLTVRYVDGWSETLVYKSENTYVVSLYSADGILMEQVKTIFNQVAGKIETQVIVDGSVNGIVPFATATPDEIAIMLKRHYSGTIDLSEFWNVGDERDFSYDFIPARNRVTELHDATTQKLKIIGFNHDFLSTGGKAAVTLQVSNGIGNAGYMNQDAVNVGGWRDSARRDWCNNAFLPAIDREIRQFIKPVDKSTSIGNQTNNLASTSDKVFFLSESEYVGTENIEHSIANEGEQYPFYTVVENRRKKQKDDVEGFDNHWTRSAARENSRQFVFIESDGDINIGDATSEYRLLPAFCW